MNNPKQLAEKIIRGNLSEAEPATGKDNSAAKEWDAVADILLGKPQTILATIRRRRDLASRYAVHLESALFSFGAVFAQLALGNEQQAKINAQHAVEYLKKVIPLLG